MTKQFEYFELNHIVDDSTKRVVVRVKIHQVTWLFYRIDGRWEIISFLFAISEKRPTIVFIVSLVSAPYDELNTI